MADHDTIQHLIYDDLGRVVANNRNGYPDKILFPGGYYFYVSADDMMMKDYYVQDYQGNNRMVVHQYMGSDFVGQTTHYYPFGGVIGDISTNQDLQDYKYSGKEFDRTYGLDFYDFHARQYDPKVPRFTSIDPKAEDYYGISPYAYCAGDPVNFIDPTGMKPDSLEAAMMCNHVYEGSGELSGGWICIYTISNLNNGLKYGIYSRLKEDGNYEYALVFAGTKDTDSKDWQTDKDQYMGEMDEWFLQDNGMMGRTQYGEAVTESKRFSSTLEGSEGTILGHSLGGGLATVGSLATGLPAMTFNPAGVHKNTINRLGLQNTNSSQITNYVIIGDPINISNLFNKDICSYGNNYFYFYKNPFCVINTI